jgi:hypothetical protein
MTVFRIYESMEIMKYGYQWQTEGEGVWEFKHPPPPQILKLCQS